MKPNIKVLAPQAGLTRKPQSIQEAAMAKGLAVQKRQRRMNRNKKVMS